MNDTPCRVFFSIVRNPAAFFLSDFLPWIVARGRENSSSRSRPNHPQSHQKRAAMEKNTPPASANSEAGQSAQMSTSPQKEHAWLQKLVGEWTVESECFSAPGQPPEKFHAIETVRSIGGLWIIGESQGGTPDGGIAQMIITLGFDSKRNRFVGTWLGSMMAYLWLYEGELDATGRILTLNAEGPSFADPEKVAKYQDIIELKTDDHRILSSRCLGEDGQWKHFTTAHYWRKR
jgi:hypothetical protein